MTPTDSQAARLHEDFVPCQCRNQSPDMEIRIQRCHGPSGVSGDLYCVYCQWCGRAVPFMSYSYGHIADVNAEAITAWNTRPREDAGVVDEAMVERAAVAICLVRRPHPNPAAYWHWLHKDEQEQYRNFATAALAAALGKTNG